MKNVLMYYYNLEIKEIRYFNNSYFFNVNNNSYIFQLCDRTNDEITELYHLSLVLFRNNIYCHQFVVNNNNDIVTKLDNKRYVLLKNEICSNDFISLNEIIDFSIKTRNIWTYSYINRFDWKRLWIDKIQNLSYQVSQFDKINKHISYCFNYYIGIVENCIQLIDNIYNNSFHFFSVSHKRLTYMTTLNEFYNPLNYIIDYSVRDIAEYIKYKLINNVEVSNEYIFCMKSTFYNEYEKELLFVRTLYPSYQLDIYEKIFFEKNNHQKVTIQSVLDNQLMYEKNVKKMYNLTMLYINDIPYLQWLI